MSMYTAIGRHFVGRNSPSGDTRHKATEKVSPMFLKNSTASLQL